MLKWQKILTIILISLALFFLDRAGFFDWSFGLIRVYIFSPLTRAVIFTGEESASLFKNIFGIRSLIQENIFLQSQRDFFREEYFKMAGAAQENEFLRQALSLEKEKGRKFILANILSFDPFSAEDSFIIDKGSQSGLKVADPVILSGGIVVGRVKDLSANQSRVLLITSPQSQVTAVAEGNKANGVVTGSASGSLNLDLVLKDTELKPGQILLTSGLDGVFPPALLLGEISRVYNDTAQSFQKAAVQPFFNLRDLKQVFIITSK